MRQHSAFILFFLKKEKNQKKNFLRKAYALLVIFSLLPMHEFEQQKAVTHHVCNGFFTVTKYDKESFG